MTKLRGLIGILGILGILLMLSGCVATQNPTTVHPEAPGFLEGLWHGFIFPLSFIASLFTDRVAVYAVPNDGGFYNFGYFVGICFLGVGARSSKRR